jgi:protein-S-isoprenylcysteine O-methyltransferase Ste14
VDRALLVRAAALYVPLTFAAAAWLCWPPNARDRAAAILATAWNLPALLALHVMALRFGWWSFDVRDATLAGFPVDLYLGWAIMWGALPSLAARRVPLAVLAIAALLADLLVMPRMTPVVRLGDAWLVGEGVAIALCFLPAQWLARWTREDTRATHRAFLQVMAFGALALGVLPQVILEQTGGSWQPLLSRPQWATALLLQCVAAAGLLGVSAVQEFATRGNGTPVPFDPPRRLVASGAYAYVRNPMQVSAALVLVLWGMLLESWWVGAAGAMAVIYGAGFAAGDESADLDRRLGAPWTTYKRLARSWIPRWRPLDQRLLAGRSDTSGGSGDATEVRHVAGATLYVAEECGPCSEVRAWFAARDPVGLEIVAAERHPSRTLARITYDPGDGAADSEGVAALGRALEHVHLGWALLGMFVRLPGVCQALQLITDASGGAQRTAVRYCERPGTGDRGGVGGNYDDAERPEMTGSVDRPFSATTR